MVRAHLIKQVVLREISRLLLAAARRSKRVEEVSKAHEA